MTGRLVILTGAPESRRLDWTTPGLLLSTFQTSIARFAQLRPSPTQHEAEDVGVNVDADTSALDLAVWRNLPLARTHIHTGFSQQHDLHLVGAFPTGADFLNTASISLDATSQQPEHPSQDDDDDDDDEASLLADFYEHSLAAHAHADDVASSQLVVAGYGSPQPQQNPAAVAITSDASFVSDTNSNARSFASEEDTTTTILEDDTTISAPKSPLRAGWARGRGAEHLSNLEDIPPAAYLLSVTPQTVTVSLVAGIINVAAPRVVEARWGRGRGGGAAAAPPPTRTLVEVLVGDETKSGFAVTFWLSAMATDATGMSETLAGLRGQDVVLIQNVALNVFRKKVYGGSLGRGMTRVHLLYRARVDEGDVSGYYSHADLARAERGVGGQGGPANQQLEKTRRVRDWVLKFVGAAPGVGVRVDEQNKTLGKQREGKERVPPSRLWNQPPPLDSQ